MGRFTFIGLALAPFFLAAGETVEGPYKANQIADLGSKGAITLHYNASTRSSRKKVQAGDYKVGVDTGIVGYGVEAYLSFTGQLVVVDHKTQKTRWYHDIGAWYSTLSFRVVKDLATTYDVALICLGGKGNNNRYFELLSGKEVFPVKKDDGIELKSTKPQELRGTSLKPALELAGDNSKVTKRHCQRITSEADWQALWERHSGDSKALPKVNFRKHMVIAVFDGLGSNTAGIKLLHTLDCENAMELFIQGDYYQTVNTANNVQAYGIFVIPRSDKKLLIKENAQNYIGGPEIWRIRKTFDRF